MLNLILVIIGTATGVLASMIGLGGGFLITPILILIFKLHPQNAIAISLFAMSGTTISATISYIRQKRVDFKLGLLYDLLDIPGIILGAYLTTILSSEVLKIICAIFIIFISLISMKKNKEENIIKNPLQNKGWQREITDSTGRKFEYIVKNISFALLSSFLGGLIAGLAGLGGGITDVSTMIFLGVPVHIAVATSEFAMALTNGAGVIAHGFLKNILWGYAIPLTLGTIIGAQIGSLIAKKTKGKFLKRIIALIAFIIGIRLLIS